MFDNSDITNTYGAGAQAAPMSGGSGSDKVKLDQEAAWKSEFRRTLEEIRDKGFSGYADEIHARKMEELREKILASMGLSESDLENMTPEQRNQIEKMVALEIQKRLSAEEALDEDANVNANNPDGLTDQIRTAPNGLGLGLVLMQEVDPESTLPPKDKDRDG